ncbi:hypothetical protein D3C85_1441350 [compost metagenome]
MPSVKRRTHHVSETLAIESQRRWVRGAVLQVVTQFAISVDIKRLALSRSLDKHHTPRTKRMSHA